jgi:hypothetical protein
METDARALIFLQNKFLANILINNVLGMNFWFINLFHEDGRYYEHLIM